MRYASSVQANVRGGFAQGAALRKGGNTVAFDRRLARDGSLSTSGLCRSAGVRVFGYASAAAEPAERSEREFQLQAESIALECTRRGLSLVRFLREREPRHQRALERPALEYALGRIAAGEASGLVVSDLSRLTHSVPELGRVLEWFAEHHARLIAAGPGLDTGEAVGRLAVRALIEIARWDRQRLIERTRDGMRAARRNGPASVADLPQLGQRIREMRAEGMTLQGIADRFNAERIPTVRGGAKWRPSSVQTAAGYQRPTR